MTFNSFSINGNFLATCIFFGRDHNWKKSLLWGDALCGFFCWDFMIIIWIFIHGKTNEFPGLWLVNKNQQYFPNNLQNITQSKKGFSKGSHKTNGSIRESRHVYGSMRQTSPAISLLIRYWGRNIFHPPKAFSWGNCYLMNLD